MKIITILGTRPEIIRLSRVIPVLDSMCEHIVVHTNQNYSDLLNGQFFRSLKLRKPDKIFSKPTKKSIGLVCEILENIEKVLVKEKPDRVLILGDTHSGLSAIVAKRLHIPVYHMEAGNRCYDDRVPEEINRKLIDVSSNVLMPYTERSRDILVKEGYPQNRIFVTGNPMFEVLEYYKKEIEDSSILKKLKINKNEYFSLDIHRAETVDNPQELDKIIKTIVLITKKYKLPIISIMHPRISDRLKIQRKSINNKLVIQIDPLNLFDFVKLEKNSFCALSDSGTVQEEGSICKFPTVLLRNVTERYETIDAGSNFVAGLDSDSVITGIEMSTKFRGDWNPPAEYLRSNVSTTVARIILGKY